MGVRLRLGGIGALAAAVLFAAPAAAQLPIIGGGTPDPNKPATPPATEPIVLTGQQLGDWAKPANQTAKLPLTDLADCPDPTKTDNCAHNHYAQPEVDTGDKIGATTPVDRLLGYRWDAKARK